MTDFSKVYYYSVFKNYIDSTHTYKDTKGVKQFLPVSKIVKRYDKVGSNGWMCVSYPGNKFTELTEHKNEVVKTDTVIVGNTVEIYSKYKTEIR